jgi:RNA polymerase sigma-70 factor (ECF subfamily)
MQSLQDNLWLEQLKSDDQKAFTSIYNHYWKKLFLYALSKVGTRETAEEIVHDVFADFWARRHETQVHSTLEGYLIQAVKFTVYKHIRTSRNREAHIQAIAHYLYEHQVQSQPSPDKLDIEKRFSESLNRLPERCREVFELSREQDLSYREIALRLSISPKTVENQISKALRFLRVAMKDYIVSILVIITLF